METFVGYTKEKWSIMSLDQKDSHNQEENSVMLVQNIKKSESCNLDLWSKICTILCSYKITVINLIQNVYHIRILNPTIQTFKQYVSWKRDTCMQCKYSKTVVWHYLEKPVNNDVNSRASNTCDISFTTLHQVSPWEVVSLFIGVSSNK